MEYIEEKPNYTPTDKEREIINLIQRHFETGNSIRSRTWRHLNDLSLNTFWQTCADLYNGRTAEKTSVSDDWKSRRFKRKTRKKVIATVAAYLASSIGLDFSAQDQQRRRSREMADILETTYEWSLEREMFDKKKFIAYMNKAIFGTLCIFEDVAWDTRTIKDIIDVDYETGKIKWEEKDITEFKGCRSEVVPIDEMFLGDAYQPDIQQQPFVIRRKVTSYENADRFLSKYDNWEHVQPGATNMFEPSDYGLDFGDEEDFRGKNVEILYYWNKYKDMMAIVCNGVLLTDPDFPIPYKHKQYPFAWEQGEPFADTKFAWGNAIPFINKDEQELVNELWNMMVDSTKLSIKPPLFTTSAELSGTDLIQPGTIGVKKPTDTVETIQQVAQGPSTASFNMVQSAERQMDENTIDPLVSGTQATGQTTATEVNAVVGSARRLQGFDEQSIGSFLVQQARLRIPNLLWFLTVDDTYNKVVKEGVQTPNGEGRREIIFTQAADVPTGFEIFRMEEEELEKDNAVERLYVKTEMIEDYRFDVSISPTPKPSKTSTSKLLEQIQKYNLYANNPIVDQYINSKKLVKAMGDDPNEMLQQPQITPEDVAGASPIPQTVQGQPEVNTALTAALADNQEV